MLCTQYPILLTLSYSRDSQGLWRECVIRTSYTNNQGAILFPTTPSVDDKIIGILVFLSHQVSVSTFNAQRSLQCFKGERWGIRWWHEPSQAPVFDSGYKPDCRSRQPSKKTQCLRLFGRAYVDVRMTRSRVSLCEGKDGLIERGLEPGAKGKGKGKASSRTDE
ncbi:hypothetical protein EJ08DRAFT_198329 [Tothia fuscella]|uniref:Uncharacterized protein n=1 Tax=Tothia fuscella TaxID=1048955 RepID=A0A9P4TZN5_9PEZI|nr:hypothetical protein EJ08DRAFT_198329 [Tothia fuscella]